MSSVDEAIREREAEFLEYANSYYADAVIFIGRILGSVPNATEAHAVALDSHGVELIITTPDTTAERRIEFDEPITGVDVAATTLLSLVQRARERSGEGGTRECRVFG